MANRLWYSNAVLDALTIITASSEQSSNPASHLKDQKRQKTVRSKVGWTVTEDNRRLPFNRGGAKVAVVALGYYVTAAEYCEAIRVALVAADAALTWTVDYGVAAAGKFRIRDTAGAPLNFSLLITSGADVYRGLFSDIGFHGADVSGTTTYTADTVAYGSRLFLRFANTGTITATAFAFLQHNLLSGVGSVTVQANATDVWSAPTFETALEAVTTDPAYEYFSNKSFAYWRLVVDNVQHPDGFAEVGVVYLGTYVEPAFCIASDLAAESEPFTTVQTGISGSHFVNVQPERDRWSIGWDAVTTAVRAVLDAFFAAVDVGECFFFDFDPATAGELVYVYRGARSWGFIPVEYRDYATQLIEAV